VVEVVVMMEMLLHMANLDLVAVVMVDLDRLASIIQDLVAVVVHQVQTLLVGKVDMALL
tara:strand:+ start:188 stop:364 length:177 start_codon:yes stop_codon:yes gene_type:complete